MPKQKKMFYLKNIEVYFIKLQNQPKKIYFKQIVKYKKVKRKEVWKNLNHIISTKCTSSCKINNVVGEKGRIVSDLEK